MRKEAKYAKESDFNEDIIFGVVGVYSVCGPGHAILFVRWAVLFLLF